MSGIASSLRRQRLGAAWAVFAAANLAAMGLLAGGDGGTIPFHFIWVSLTIVYAFTGWRHWPVLILVMSSTSALIVLEIETGPTRPDELTEVPLMAAMFLAMVWHSRRRAAAEAEAIRGRERERDFIRDASHTLKTPLALARGYSELLLAETRNGSPNRDAAKIVGELDRLTKIVDNLLLLMVSDREHAFRRRPADLSELVVGVTDRWLGAVDRRFLIDADEPVIVLGDHERLEVVLDELIENATEATTAGDRIWVSVSCADSTARIQVANEGRGISSEAAERIFERFWSEGGSRKGRGTGLGLAIVKTIVDGHGGTVDVSSSDGRTVFTIELPTADVDEPPSQLPITIGHRAGLAAIPSTSARSVGSGARHDIAKPAAEPLGNPLRGGSRRRRGSFRS